MTEWSDWYQPTREPFAEIEAMVRSAGQYVRASDDLRPRVLETARTQCGERWAQRCIRRVALFVILTAIFTVSGGRELDSAAAPRQLALVTADAERSLLRAQADFPVGGDSGWGVVEAFSELRREQAKVLRRTL